MWNSLAAAGLAAAAALSPARAVADEAPVLRFLGSVPIADRAAGFDEPSGLALLADGRAFLSVSDDSHALYTLAPDGRLADRLKLAKRIDGLEGVALDAVGQRVLMVREEARELVTLDLGDGAKVRRFPLERMAGFAAMASLWPAGEDTDGLEGITVVPGADRVVVLKENAPRLMMDLSADLSTIRSAMILSADLGFLDDDTGDDRLDVSGIAHDPVRDAFWISSDTGRRVFLFDPAAGRAIGYPLVWLDGDRRREVHNAEGVALSAHGTRLFIVNDDGAESRLFEYAVE